MERCGRFVAGLSLISLARTVLAGALVLSTAAAAGAATEPLPITPALAARIDTALGALTGTARGSTPSVSVAVVEDGRVAYVRAFGNADQAAGVAATPGTRYPIASVTKMFTAVAVMQLVERGAVRLDAPLATYLPTAPHGREVTIRQLLDHTSALWNYGDQAFQDGTSATATTPAAIIASLASRPLEHAPGMKFAYSNTGYVLLGLVVEAVARQPLAAYERTHILGPAAMTETTFGSAPPGTPAARGYMDATGTAPPTYSLSWLYADGDVVSTAADVARFDVALMDGRLVRPATFAEMRSAAVDAPELGPGERYGLGLTLTASGGVVFAGHHGGMPGFETENELLPERRFAIVVLSNAFDFPTPRANVAVLAAVMPSVLAAAAAELRAAEQPAVSAAVRGFVTGLAAGTVDPASLSPEMRAALTPDVLHALGAQLAPLGALQKLAFRAGRRAGRYTTYDYDATFAGGRVVTLTVTVDDQGKIAGYSPEL